MENLFEQLQHIFICIYSIYTGSFTALGIRNEANPSLFLDFWGPQSLSWTPKDGRKLLLGKKHTTLGLMVSQDCGQKRGKFKDPVNWALYTGCLEHDFFFNGFDFQYYPSFLHYDKLKYRFLGYQMKEWTIGACPIHQILNFFLFLTATRAHH